MERAIEILKKRRKAAVNIFNKRVNGKHPDWGYWQGQVDAYKTIIALLENLEAQKHV